MDPKGKDLLVLDSVTFLKSLPSLAAMTLTWNSLRHGCSSGATHCTKHDSDVTSVTDNAEGGSGLQSLH